MKTVEFSSWFDEQEASFAVFSTFDFDPAHFESRLLRSRCLAQARRILVFVDANQFGKALIEKRPSRWINHRYLVVPIRKHGGAFHPKLILLFGEQNATVLCGSNNLTQPGSAHNIELLNATFVTAENESSLANAHVVHETFNFLNSSVAYGEGAAAEIAKTWLSEAAANHGWLPEESKTVSGIQLIHSFKKPLWQWLTDQFGGSSPQKLTVISPFFDSDLRLLDRVRSQWPKCAVDIIAQQRTSNLPARSLKNFGRSVKLFELKAPNNRKLHGKLVLATTNRTTLCLAGSANFTAAAFDGINIEACLAWQTSEDVSADLFSGAIKRHSILPEDFEPGEELPPDEQPTPQLELKILSAQLDANDKISVAFAAANKPQQLNIGLQSFGEKEPAIFLPLKVRKSNHAERQMTEDQVANLRGAVACQLVAKSNGSEIVSPISWLIQEQKLTHEQGDGGNTGRERDVRETGRGLTEFLDWIGQNEGRVQLVQYLWNLNIRFDDKSSHGGGRRHSGLHPRDPFRPDTIPDWVLADLTHSNDVAEAICEFADRHEDRVLRRHARRANVNGLSNFLDVLIAVTKLLFVYYRRQILPRSQVVGRLVKYIGLFSSGIDTEEDRWPGYLSGLFESLAGNLSQLRKSLDEHCAVAHLRALLLIAQEVRAESEDQVQRSLPSASTRVERCLRTHGLGEPKRETLESALRDYEMLPDSEINRWLSCFA